jgi:hypothetical protein
MILLLLAVLILLPMVLAVCGVGRRSHYVGLSVGSFILGLFMGLIGREVKSQVLFGIWILVIAVFLGFLLASLFYRRRSAAG